MTFRIHFTAEDLARTRVADRAMPLFELGLALRALRDGTQAVRLDSWRRDVRRRLRTPARMVLSLVPPTGYSPIFLAPPYEGTPDEALDLTRATPSALIKKELAAIAEEQPIPSWTHYLADDAALFDQLVSSLGDLYVTLLGGYWPQVTDLFAADRALRMRQLLTGGIESLLTQANPQWLRWKPPILEMRTRSPLDHDLFLQGQGIMLVPSAFTTHSNIQIPCDEARPQPILSYPVNSDKPLHRLTTLTPHHDASKPNSAVAALLGHTRSTVLETIAEHPGCTTRELATLAGVAPSSASEHATVLRQAGLVNTTRHHNTALHTPTNLGIALLNAGHGTGREGSS